MNELTNKKNAEGEREVVNHPEHYSGCNGIECIDALKASMTKEQFIGFLRGNAQKYLWRVGRKDDLLQDLKKAQWYLNYLVSELSN